MAASSSRDTPLSGRLAELGRGGNWTAVLGSPRVASGTPPLMLEKVSLVSAERSLVSQFRQRPLERASLIELVVDVLVDSELLGGLPMFI